MRQVARQRRRRFGPALVCTACWLAMGVAPGTAAAQVAVTPYFSASGANGSYPVNLFPFDPAADFLDFTGNTVAIGSGAPGSFSAQAGGVLFADQLQLGTGGSGNGTATVSDIGTRIDLFGSSNRLDVGNWGAGSLTVSGGAVVDGRRNLGACGTSLCNSFIGNAAGSTGTLTITGAGSQVALVRNFVVGQTAVFSAALDGFDFGTPGGTTTGVVNVLAGGSLDTQVATIGRGPNRPAALGTEQGYGSVIVDGPGSRWRVTRNTLDPQDAFVVVGTGVGGHGAVTVRNGGQMVIDGSGGNPAGFATLNLGSNGGEGSVTVSGIGSTLSVAALNPVINVGRSGASGSGSFSVLAGAWASAMFMSVGRDGATGNVVLDGTGTQLTLAGVAAPSSGSGAAFLNIGRGGGNGTFTVSGGARLTITDGGGDSSVLGLSPGVAIGRDAGSTGAMTITGAGSMVEVVSTSLGLDPGQADNMNPFFAVGFDNPGSASGTLTVSQGGRLVLNGGAVSGAAYPRVTSFNVGGRGSGPATGTATITGAGSEVVVAGADGLVNVGRSVGGNGTLNLLDQARLATISMVVGDVGNGTVNVDNARIDLAGYRTDGTGFGAGVTIGRGAGGVGALNMSHGAWLSLTNDTLAGGVSIGGDTTAAGGTGTVTMSGGSRITFAGSVSDGSLNVGRYGTGTLDMSGGSLVDVGDTRAVHIGRTPTGAGNLLLSGGAVVRAGTISIGGDNDATPGGTATASVTGPGSALQASGGTGFISVGRGGVGTLALGNQASLSATVLNVGRSAGGVGTFTADNAVIQLSGQQASGIGAAVSVGNRGGNGTAVLSNGTQLTVTNLGSGGASLNVGGTPINPLGTGNLQVSNSQVRLVASPGKAVARIGHDGTGTAVFDGSTLDVGDGAVVVAGQPGSTGTLTLNGGSVINAGYVGVGASPAGPGGAGHLILNDSTINTTTLEIGAQGILSGNGGVVNALGDVIVAGVIDPGNSPGRININCNIITLPGSRIVLDVLANGSGGYDVDRLIIGNESFYNLTQAEIVVNFLGNTNPNAFAAAGRFDLDTFMRQGVNNEDVGGLSSAFASGVTWTDVVAAGRVVAQSSSYVVTDLQLRADGSFDVTAVPVPEPGTWAMMLMGLVGLGRGLPRLRARRAGAPAR